MALTYFGQKRQVHLQGLTQWVAAYQALLQFSKNKEVGYYKMQMVHILIKILRGLSLQIRSAQGHFLKMPSDRFTRTLSQTMERCAAFIRQASMLTYLGGLVSPVRLLLATLLLSTVTHPAYSDTICQDVTDEAVIRATGEVVREELRNRGIPVTSDTDRDMVQNCRDFLIYSLSFDQNVLGGVPYVVVSYQGEILWVMETY